MLEVRKSARAERDLIDIWGYGFERWGDTGADRYAHRIEDALRRLQLQPGLGVDSRDVLPGLRRWRVGSHHIYYKVHADHLYVVRVLGARQDAPSRLLD